MDGGENSHRFNYAAVIGDFRVFGQNRTEKTKPVQKKKKTIFARGERAKIAADVFHNL